MSFTGRLTDEQFIHAFKQYGGAQAMADAIGMKVRGIHGRRRAIERRTGQPLLSTSPRSPDIHITTNLPRRGIRAIPDTIRGTVIVFSDAHYWPGEPSTAHKALVRLCKQLQPVMIVANGDLMDGARLCSQIPAGWVKSQAPTIKQEIEALQERMTEVALAVPKRCLRIRTIGNHDIRLERTLAMRVPEIEGLPHTTLSDYIGEWEATWSIMVNDNTMIKHRQAGGVHAAYNNTMKGGKSMVTGHLHRLIVTPWADYNGTRWGVDTGTLAEVGPENPAFEYDEDNARPWTSGFAVLTYDSSGMLLPPELVTVIGGRAYFRGKEV